MRRLPDLRNAETKKDEANPQLVRMEQELEIACGRQQLVLPGRSALGKSVVHSGSRCSPRSAAFSPAITLSELTAVGTLQESRSASVVETRYGVLFARRLRGAGCNSNRMS